MPSLAQPINIAVGNTATDLYEAFIDGSATVAQIVSLDFCNTTTGDLTLDVWHEPAGGGTNIYLFDDVVVPAKGKVEWRGMMVLDASTEKLQAQGSAAGIDCLGAVVESW